MMKYFGLSALTLAGILMTSSAANAFSIKGWQYSRDSFNDSSGLLPDGTVGIGSGTNFEMYSLATRIHEGEVQIAVRSNLGLGGAESRLAYDKRIHWGDMILNVACDALDRVGRESLFGIRFERDNESGVTQVGLFENIELFELAAANGNRSTSISLNNFGDHNRYVQSKGGSPSVGNLPDNYFDENTHVPSLIRSGTFLGAVEVIEDTSDWGLDGFNDLDGQTTAIAFDLGLLSLSNSQSVCLHIAPECNNDILGGQFQVDLPEPEIVPTPAAVLPVLSGLFTSAKRQRKKEAEA